jgi:hypothetical protein
MQAFEIRIVLHERWSGVVKGVKRLVGGFTVIQ